MDRITISEIKIQSQEVALNLQLWLVETQRKKIMSMDENSPEWREHHKLKNKTKVILRVTKKTDWGSVCICVCVCETTDTRKILSEDTRKNTALDLHDQPSPPAHKTNKIHLNHTNIAHRNSSVAPHNLTVSSWSTPICNVNAMRPKAGHQKHSRSNANNATHQPRSGRV